MGEEADVLIKEGICPLSDSLLEARLELESQLLIPGPLCFPLPQAVSKSSFQKFSDLNILSL